MKKTRFIGFDKTGNYCCLLKSPLSFEQIKDNLYDLEVDDFIHRSTNWNGCDSLERILTFQGLRLTGRSVDLPQELVFEGEDHDMGHSYQWSFSVTRIAEAVITH